MNIGLCDDDKDFLALCKDKVQRLATANRLEVAISEFSCGESLSFFCDDNPENFDILIIDMLMDEMNGIDTARDLRGKGYDGLVIFLTSSEEYALESFGVGPFNYLLKQEIEEEKFETVLLSAFSLVEKVEKKKLVIVSRSKSVVVTLDDVLFIESSLRKVVIHSKSGKQEAQHTLDDMFSKVNEHGFLRCHKSYVVNSRYIKSFSRTEVALLNGSILPVGRVYFAGLELAFLNHVQKKIIL